MREIPLTRGHVALVDDEDYEALAKYKWQARARRMRNGAVVWYAGRSEPRPGRRVILMHRQIMGEPAGMDVDHKRGDGRDNQKENLRVATRSQNAQNHRFPHLGKTSRHPGVSWHKTREKWVAYIRAGERKGGRAKTIYLGLFEREEDAAAAYRAAARLYFGEFAPS